MNKIKNVVMLPTKKAIDGNNIFITDQGLDYIFVKSVDTFEQANLNWKPQHIYIFSKEKIDDGDYFLSDYKSFIIQNTKEWRAQQHENGIKNIDLSKNCKIIASNDPSLQFNGNLNPTREVLERNNYVPKINDHFVQRYVSQGGIDEVLLEYDWLQSNVDSPDGHEYELKLRDDNSVIIHRSKTYSREEVMEKFRHFRTDVLPFGQVVDAELNDWFEKNL